MFEMVTEKLFRRSIFYGSKPIYEELHWMKDEKELMSKSYIHRKF